MNSPSSDPLGIALLFQASEEVVEFLCVFWNRPPTSQPYSLSIPTRSIFFFIGVSLEDKRWDGRRRAEPVLSRSTLLVGRLLREAGDHAVALKFMCLGQFANNEVAVGVVGLRQQRLRERTQDAGALLGIVGSSRNAGSTAGGG